jgi:hypothetical protein
MTILLIIANVLIKDLNKNFSFLFFIKPLLLTKVANLIISPSKSFDGIILFSILKLFSSLEKKDGLLQPALVWRPTE